MKKYSSLLPYVLFLATLLGAGIVFYVQRGKIDKLTASNSFYKADNDTLRVIVNTRKGEVEYHKQLFQGSQKDVELLKVKYDSIYEIAKNPKVQTVVKTRVETRIDTVTELIEITKDSIGRETRTSDINHEYYKAKVISYPDSTRLKLQAWSPIVLAVEKDGKIKATTPINSPISITEIQGYNKVEPKKRNRWWIPLGIGIASGIAGTIYLTK